MDGDLETRERELEHLRVQAEIEDTKARIEEKKAYERQMKKVEGKDWKKMFGSAMKSVRPNQEAIQDMYSINPALRDLNRPGRRGK